MYFIAYSVLLNLFEQGYLLFMGQPMLDILLSHIM
jgi:hypothetical protein